MPFLPTHFLMMYNQRLALMQLPLGKSFGIHWKEEIKMVIQLVAGTYMKLRTIQDFLRFAMDYLPLMAFAEVASIGGIC